jgi:hypothetical protein
MYVGEIYLFSLGFSAQLLHEKHVTSHDSEGETLFENVFGRLLYSLCYVDCVNW